MFTAHVRDILPRKKELAEIEAEMNARLAALPLPPEMAGKPLILCGVGGTARALRKVSDKLLSGAEQEGVPCKRITRVRRMLETDREVLKGAVLKCAPDRLSADHRCHRETLREEQNPHTASFSSEEESPLPSDSCRKRECRADLPLPARA